VCGIAGYWTPGGLRPDAEARLVAMTAPIAHRGPDDSGTWLDPEAGIALGHRRLSILDLSPEGHQPMRSVSGRYVMVFNGEIYNFVALRQELEAKGFRFRGHSDTEVMLAAFEAWGLLDATRRMAGQFAFAVWDRETRTLYLARDRFGEKPLYCGWSGGTFLFGSELKALRAHPTMRSEIDRDAVALYARHNYIPAPFTIYKGITKLLPGHLTTVRGDGQVTLAPYWSLADAVAAGQRDPLSGSDDELVTAVESRLRETIGEEMVADVPLGALLSGGIDSTAVVALMQQQSGRPVLTFTIGFHEPGFNEAEHAKAVAAHLGTQHTELYVTPAEAREVIPRLPAMYDEPFADSSQIPTFLVSELARRHVTVALSGDGGDEIFGGYARYAEARNAWERISRLPVGLRTVAGAALEPVAERTGRLRLTSRLLQQETALGLYEQLMSQWSEPSRLVRGATEPSWRRLPEAVVPGGLSLIEQFMYLDSLNYLPDDVLVKVDRASMAVSLETRAPILDHRVAELAWRLPFEARVRGGVTKWALRQIVYRHVPRELVDRPKRGFSVPVGNWVRGPLRDWARSLTDRRRIEQEGYFSAAAVRRLQSRVERGDSGASQLWLVLMFQAWLEAQQASRQPAAA
jgi:asparagine synthase (glutamine-hydrolysing)